MLITCQSHCKAFLSLSSFLTLIYKGTSVLVSLFRPGSFCHLYNSNILFSFFCTCDGLIAVTALFTRICRQLEKYRNIIALDLRLYVALQVYEYS